MMITTVLLSLLPLAGPSVAPPVTALEVTLALDAPATVLGGSAEIHVAGTPLLPYSLAVRPARGGAPLLRIAGRLDEKGMDRVVLGIPARAELTGASFRIDALVLDPGGPRAASAVLRIAPVAGGSGGAVAAGGQSHTAPAPVPPFRIVSCSLACSSSGPGEPISCSIFAVPTQATLRFELTLGLDLSSVSLQTVRIVNVGNGQTPAGTFSLEPDGRTLVWQGTLVTNDTYQVTIPGVNQDPAGPYLLSTERGLANADRLQCSFVAL